MKTTCHYKFPCHPQDMMSNTPDRVDSSARMLRVQIINMIAQLSQKYNQQQINEKLFVDIDENQEIIGLDISKLSNMDIDFALGTLISVGDLTAEDWTNMRIMSSN